MTCHLLLREETKVCILDRTPSLCCDCLQSDHIIEHIFILLNITEKKREGGYVQHSHPLVWRCYQMLGQSVDFQHFAASHMDQTAAYLNSD